ncbi:MAG: organomercurial lyase [Gammaproteobacteria bacterium]
MDIPLALAQLNAQLPLKARQEQLPMALKVLHQKMLTSLLVQGRVPDTAECADLLGEVDVNQGLRRLVEADLLVLDTAGKRVVGAYPLTLAQTAHRVTVRGHRLCAMCALDAMAIAPMFNVEVMIESSCHLSKTPIVIHMHGRRIIAAPTETQVQVGIRWQMPAGVAAHSMCQEMVFLAGELSARTWQGGDWEKRSLFTLAEAAELGEQFFAPLLE